MRNGLSFATVHALDVLSDTSVVITINLHTHRHLTDPNVVQYAMDEFMRVLPGLTYWEASAEDGWLYIKAEGTIDQRALAHWRKD